MKDFNTAFIVGAQRCGTTYLYKVLEQHPELSLAKPIRPEPKFFLNQDEIEKGKNHYINKYFNEVAEGQTLIEKGTSYIESTSAATQIKKMFPNTKIIVILRNPVERAISNYYFSRKNGIENRSLEEVFLEQKPPPKINFNSSVSPFDYLERGKYSSYLNRYFKIFDRQNIGVFIFEELISNKNKINNVLDFLKVDNFKRLPKEAFQKINYSSNKSEINYEVIYKLKKYFYEYNKRLELLLNRGIDAWE